MTRRFAQVFGEIKRPHPHGPGGWWLLPEPDLHLGADVMVPDVAGWRRERLPDFPDESAIAHAPDWACEVLSPQSGRTDPVIKGAIYQQNRVSFLWSIDYRARSLEVRRLTDKGWLSDGIDTNQDVARARPFDAIDLPLGDLWPD